MAGQRGGNPRSGRANPTKGQAAEYLVWDEFVGEATKGMTPFRLRVSADETLTIECPTDDDMAALAAAEQIRDRVGMAQAIFGDEHGPRILELAGSQPFPVMAKLVERVMMHYGLSADEVPED